MGVCFLKQSTQQAVPIGPIIDSTDYSGETAVTHATAGLNVDCIKADGTLVDVTTQDDAPGDWYLLHVTQGNYMLTLKATDCSVVGALVVAVAATGMLMPSDRFYVLEEAVYDAKYAASSTGLLPANVTQWLGQAAVAVTTNGYPKVEVAMVDGHAVAAHSAGGAGYLPVELARATDQTLSAKVGLNMETFFQDGGATAVTTLADITAMKAVTDKVATMYVIVGAGPNYQWTASALALGPVTAAAPIATAVADAVLDRDYSTHVTADTLGEVLNNMATPEDVAAAVGEEPLAGHVTPDTIGAAITQIATDAGTAATDAAAAAADAATAAGMAAQFTTMVVLNGSVYEFTALALANAPSGALIASVLTEAQKLTSMIENIGGGQRFKEHALEEAPTGGGGAANFPQVGA